jgi:predicted nucleic acid-binding protein
MFDQRVLPVTEDIGSDGGFWWKKDGKAGHTYSQPDLIIAATALHHGFTIVTRDGGDFERAGVPVINPWDA